MARLSFGLVSTVLVAGVVLGLLLAAVLPKSPVPMAAGRSGAMVPYSLPVQPGHSLMPPGKMAIVAKPPPVTRYTPWLLIVLGAGFAAVFRSNAGLVGIGSAVVTSGLTALLVT